ncbi:mannose-1-phosphate guanylyltransferase [Nonlabens dokdonensis]|jgi:mannose-1-phosphate guanylyltransferase|uniref:mannose-1-phosphate guanylyltransferase n=2 Tax=Nonlabens dokdonensis TaxID=328515 RepID=L7WFH1_NONDD|nr:mannose-1-phosphate guanylyltransferase [Nonlabens dokdonensis]AGC78706.1 mannose-1-phosphate guanylyltransferase [Nonlabens dokdonensis DSW-6]PZX39167.1 mannose-1-phosphate guanylyltransferase [Nonlabens dokdonensis]
MSSNNYAVIMAGGVGSRFWPVSKQSFPKQFHDMLGLGRSLLQMTYDRLKKQIPSSQILVLTNADYVDLVKEQLPDITFDNIVAEPSMRNTAPCILLAALKIQKMNPSANMIVAPSDHYIEDEDVFNEDLTTAFEFCGKNEQALLTLGIQPSSPNTGFGYIEYNKEENQLKKVSQFREKPDLETAKSFIAAGNFLWNAGIFIWNVAGVVSAFAKAQPQLSSLFKDGLSVFNTDAEDKWLENNYPNAENISVDYAIMEKSDAVYVLPARFSWNDLGTWGSLYDKLDKNENANAVVNADLMAMNSSGNMIRTAAGKKVIVQGLEDYIIVDQDDVLMIIPLSAEQEIKEIRSKAMASYGNNIG